MKRADSSSGLSKNKKNKKGRNAKGSMIFHILIGIFLVYSVSTLISQQSKINSKADENSKLLEQIEMQKVKNEELSEMVRSENRDEYYAQIARESLNYVGMGERVFVDISSM